LNIGDFLLEFQQIVCVHGLSHFAYVSVKADTAQFGFKINFIPHINRKIGVAVGIYEYTAQARGKSAAGHTFYKRYGGFDIIQVGKIVLIKRVFSQKINPFIKNSAVKRLLMCL